MVKVRHSFVAKNW